MDMDDFNLMLWNDIINEDVEEAVAELAIGRDILPKANAFQLSERKFVQLFRVNKDLCREIIDMVTPFVAQPTRTSALSIQTKVLAALRFYASGSYQEITGSNSFVGISQASTSRALNEVTNALNQPEILNNIIRFPRNVDELQNLRTRFYENFQFPGVIGCVDCTHVSIVAPPTEDEHFPEHVFVNRKNYHSLNVQLVCDNNLRILNVNSRFPGSTHDAHIWRESAVSNLMERLYRRDPANVFFLLGDSEVPKFTTPVANITVALGREAVFECGIDNLSIFKVAWLRVDTQTLLTIHNHVITKNHRIAVTHAEHRNWYLHIRDVRRSDEGWYMCQINTDPMKSQVGYLNVVVPPDILDYPTSSDMVIREGSNVSLQCTATGSPEPSITWRRENGELISSTGNAEVSYLNGAVLNISKVNRLQMGPYLCIASNGVPPSVSKRIMLIVHFPPMIWIQNQLVGAMEGQMISLECHSEAFPKSINYWTRDDSRIISSQGTKYDPIFVDNTYKVHMKLTIRNVTSNDYGSYRCIAKNSLGETDGTIKLYQITSPVSLSASKTTQPSPKGIKNIRKFVRENADHNTSSYEEAEISSRMKMNNEDFSASNMIIDNKGINDEDQQVEYSNAINFKNRYIVYFVILFLFI